MVCHSGINTIFVNSVAVDFVGNPTFTTTLSGAGGGSFESETYFVLAQMQKVEFRNISGTPLFKGFIREVSFKFGPGRTASYKLDDYSNLLKRKIIYGDFEGTVDDVLLGVINMSGTGSVWAGAASVGITDSYKRQFTGQHLGEALQAICQDIGLRYFIEPTGELRIRTIESESELGIKRTVTLPYDNVCNLNSDVIENIGYTKKFPELSTTTVFGGENPKFVVNFVPFDKEQFFDIPIAGQQQHFKIYNDAIAVRDVIMTISDGVVEPPGYTISVSPESSSTIYVSGCRNYIVTVTPHDGFTGDVDLSIVDTPFPTGVTYSFTPATVSIIDENPVTATLRICSTTIDCYAPCNLAVGYFQLSAGGGGDPSCPSCETMYVTFKAYITNPESTDCIGEVVTVTITNPSDHWWTASESSIMLTIAEDEDSATGVTVEFYPNGCESEGCGPNDRSWVGPDGDCSSQNTEGGYSVTWPNGEIETGTYVVSDQGGC